MHLLLVLHLRYVLLLSSQSSAASARRLADCRVLRFGSAFGIFATNSVSANAHSGQNDSVFVVLRETNEWQVWNVDYSDWNASHCELCDLFVLSVKERNQ